MKKISTLVIVGIITSVSFPAMSANNKEGKDIYVNRATTSFTQLNTSASSEFKEAYLKILDREKKEDIVAGLFGLFRPIF